MIDKAEDMDELQKVLKDEKKLRELYQDMESPELEDLIQQGIYLSHLIGRSMESYMEGRSSIMSIKGDKGKSLKLVPDLLVVPPALEETARLILEADQIDGTTNVLKGTAKLHVEPALAEHPEYWFLLCTNRFLKPFIYQLRKKIKFTSLTRDTDENVFMLDEYLYGADGRSNAGYGFWQMAYGSTGEVEAQAQG